MAPRMTTKQASRRSARITARNIARTIQSLTSNRTGAIRRPLFFRLGRAAADMNMPGPRARMLAHLNPIVVEGRRQPVTIRLNFGNPGLVAPDDNDTPVVAQDGAYPAIGPMAGQMNQAQDLLPRANAGEVLPAANPVAADLNNGASQAGDNSLVKKEANQQAPDGRTLDDHHSDVDDDSVKKEPGEDKPIGKAQKDVAQQQQQQRKQERWLQEELYRKYNAEHQQQQDRQERERRRLARVAQVIVGRLYLRLRSAQARIIGDDRLIAFLQARLAQREQIRADRTARLRQLIHRRDHKFIPDVVYEVYTIEIESLRTFLAQQADGTEAIQARLELTQENRRQDQEIVFRAYDEIHERQVVQEY